METDRQRLDQLYAAIRNIRDQKGDDRCWKDYEALFKLLPEGYESPAMDTEVELQNCRDYIRACRNPATTYVSPQRRIEELEAALQNVQEALAAHRDKEDYIHPIYGKIALEELKYLVVDAALQEQQPGTAQEEDRGTHVSDDRTA